MPAARRGDGRDRAGRARRGRHATSSRSSASSSTTRASKVRWCAHSKRCGRTRAAPARRCRRRCGGASTRRTARSTRAAVGRCTRSTVSSAWVRDRAAIVSGLADATMSHDDTWRFIVLGRSLERVDLTVRLLSTRLGDAWGSAGWVATLRCCAAYESYLRTYRRGVEGSKALEFLLLDRLFPRSVFHALGAAETALFDLDPDVRPARRGQRTATRRRPRVRRSRVHPGRRARAFAARASRPARTSVRARARRHREAVLQRRARHPVERVMAWRLSIEHVTQLRVRRGGTGVLQRSAYEPGPRRDADGPRPSRRRPPERSGHALHRLLGYRSERVRRARAARPAHRRRAVAGRNRRSRSRCHRYRLGGLVR